MWNSKWIKLFQNCNYYRGHRFYSEHKELFIPRKDHIIVRKKAELIPQKLTEIDLFNEYIQHHSRSLIDKHLTASYVEYIRGKKRFKSYSDRAFTILKDDIKFHRGDLEIYPTLLLNHKGHVITETLTPFTISTDIVIVGAGMVGSSIAYHIKRLLEDEVKVTLVDTDFSLSKSQTKNSIGILHHQFSSKELIELSKYASGFIDNIKDELGFEDYVPDIGFNYAGCLTLANKDGLSKLKKDFKLQKKNDVLSEFRKSEGLKNMFPWLETTDIAGGVLGLEQEGWFDHTSLLSALHRKLAHMGTDFVTGEVVDADVEMMQDFIPIASLAGHVNRATGVQVKLFNGFKRRVECGILVLAAGANSSEVGRRMYVGHELEMEYTIQSIPIPVAKRNHITYSFKSNDGPGLNFPILRTPCGLTIRRDGIYGNYLCLCTPSEEVSDPKKYFDEVVKSSLSKIVKPFQNCQYLSSNISYSDYNEFDGSPIIGFHPGLSNLFIATGFETNSFQALGTGNYFMEKILNLENTINLDQFNMKRILKTACIPDEYQTKNNFYDKRRTL